MNVNFYAFLLPSIAGLATLIGTILIFFNFKNKNNIICGSLAFAAGVMISISFLDLIPESYNLLNDYFYYIPCLLIIGIFFCIGAILSMIIDKYLPEEKSREGLYRVGLISMVAIIIHNIPEGIATFIATSSNIKLGISLTLAIAFHNIPEGISISIPIYYSTKSRGKAFFYTLISALSEPFGALLAFLFLKSFINNLILGCLFAIIAGIMFRISVKELITESLKYNNRLYSILFIIIGCVVTLITHLVF